MPGRNRARDAAMSLDPSPGSRLDRAASEFGLAPAPAPGLFWNAAADAGALAEAARALIELELPGWRLRRLVLDDGEWHCALSRHPALPLELDDMAEGRHASLSLAILAAGAEALRSLGAARAAMKPAVPIQAARPSRFRAVCCDNFR